MNTCNGYSIIMSVNILIIVVDEISTIFSEKY